MRQYFHSPESFQLESGISLPGITIAYDTFGTLNPEADNAVWVMHALTANSDVADWWPHTVETGKFLDPEKYFIICANVIGSCYGSTGPCTPLLDGTPPLYRDFPDITVRDMVEAHRLLAKYLGIKKINTIIGSSLGGFQAIEWLAGYPDEMSRAVLIATDYQCRPWLAAINEAMNMAIETDPSYGDPTPHAAKKGLATARAVALLSYRSHSAYDQTQADQPQRPDPFRRRVQTYQQYQGKKLTDRFDVYSYVRMCRSADSHDVSRGRGSFQEALARINVPCLVVAISSDILFPPEYHQEMADMIPNSQYKIIDSQFAHDGFLIEHQKLDNIIQQFYKNTNNKL